MQKKKKKNKSLSLQPYSINLGLAEQDTHKKNIGANLYSCEASFFFEAVVANNSFRTTYI